MASYTNQSSAERASSLHSWQCHSSTSPEFPVLQLLSSQTKCNFQALMVFHYLSPENKI